jgi:NAD(P)H-dependent FMN reductase
MMWSSPSTRASICCPTSTLDDDADPLPSPVVDLRARIAASDAVLFSTPEYAGALPGSFKKLLDWTVGGIELYRKPVAWVNASGSPTNAAGAHESLRKMLGYVGTDLVEAACVHIPVPRSTVGADGLIEDQAIRTQLPAVLRTLAEHVAGHDNDAGPTA